MKPPARILDRIVAPARRFAQQNAGSTSVELVIVLPLLLWALAATVVFYDGFRARYQAQIAAQTVADILSRETDLLNASYIEGLNGVFDFMNESRTQTRVRVSSVIWDAENDQNLVQWSYGSRDLLPLPPDVFAFAEGLSPEDMVLRYRSFVDWVNDAMDPDNTGTPTAIEGGFIGNVGSGLFANATGFLAFDDPQLSAMLPVSDLASRIPPVLPGEALLVVETFAPWQPFASVGMATMRFDPVVVVRPRFAPWLNFEGVDPIYPSDDYEIDWTGSDDDDDTGDDPSSQDGTVVAQHDFDAGSVHAGTAGWSQTTVSTTGPSGGFLGPFGRETRDSPLTYAVDLGTTTHDAVVQFDLLAIDSWDGVNPVHSNPGGDAFQFGVDGLTLTMDVLQAQARHAFGRTRQAEFDIAGMRIAYSMELLQSGSSFAGQDRWPDQVWRVQARIINAPRRFTLSFAAAVNSTVGDESFGIDNVVVTRIARPDPAPSIPTRPAVDALGPDALTRLPRYVGCADPRLPGPTFSMAAEDLTGGVTLGRIAGGVTPAERCGTHGGVGYVNANPALILNFDDQGRDSRLVITTDDGQEGRQCDTVLIVQDSHGQWWFNDDATGLNSAIAIPNAPSGTYRVWMGTYDGGACECQLSISDGQSLQALVLQQ